MVEDLVSIVVPIYLSEDYLGECLDSIINQTHPHLDIILVNDGSPDGSGILCDQYASRDNRIRVIYKKNGGVSSARNIGIKIAKGEYIVFVDSDDKLELNSIEKRLEYVYENKLTISGFYSDYVAATTPYSRTFCYNPNEIISYITKDQFVNLLQKGALNSPCDKIYFLNIIQKFNIEFDEDLSIGEDLLFNLEYLSYNNEGFIYINQPLYHCIIRGNESLCSKYYPNLFDLQMKKNETILYYCINKFSLDGDELSIIYDIYLKDLIRCASNIYLNNKSDSWLKKFQLIKEIMESSQMIKTLNFLIEHNSIGRIKYFLLKRKMFFTYKLFEKIGFLN